MKKRTISVLSTIAFTVLLLLLSITVYSRRIIANFVGMNVCINCHGCNAIGNQHKMWLSSPHAKAYQILATSKSRAISEKIGIKDPTGSLKCLKCHTTGGGKVTLTREEGVGCEACHGPGSRYYEYSNHVSFNNRERAYRNAVKLGMYPIIGINRIKSREKLCRHCHNESRPCFPESPEERKREKLPLSLIADFIFKHPLRR